MKFCFHGASLLLVLFAFSACDLFAPQAKGPAPAPKEEYVFDLAPNQLSTTVSGIILDGLGNPVEGVTVSYSDGNNPNAKPTVLSKSLNSDSTDSQGVFEIQLINSVWNSGATTSGGTVYVSLAKDGYTGRRLAVQLPKITDLTNEKVTVLNAAGNPQQISINVGQTVSLDASSSGGQTSTTVQNNVGGFKIAMSLGKTTMLELAGEVTGYIKLKNNDNDPNDTATIPPAGTVVAFNLPNSASYDFSPYVFLTKTDETGMFVFSKNEQNALPLFGKDNVNYWGSGNSSGALNSAPTFSVQMSGSDSTGFAFYNVNSASTSNASLFNNLSIVSQDEKNPQNLTTLYAIADKNARIVNWSPLTSADGTTTRMPVLTSGNPTPLIITFNKAILLPSDPAYDTKRAQLAALITLQETTTGNYFHIQTPDVTFDDTGKIATIKPAIVFPKNSTIKLLLQSWTAADGNAVTNPSTGTLFTTEKGIELIGASWIDLTTLNQVDKPITGKLTLTFSQAISSFDAANTVLYDRTNSVNVAASIVIKNSNQLEISPVANLSNSTQYTVKFSVLSGQTNDPASSWNDSTLANSRVDSSLLRFTTVSSLAISSTSLTTNMSLSPSLALNFNMEIEPSTAEFYLVQDVANNGYIYDSQQIPLPAPTIVWGATSNNVTLTPASALANGKKYSLGFRVYAKGQATLSLDNIRTTSGTAQVGYKANSPILQFTTIAASIPVVTTTNIQSGNTEAQNFPYLSTSNANAITITYDQAIVTTGLGAPIFTLSSSTTGAVVPVIVATFSTDNKTVTLTPDVSFTPDSNYSLTYNVTGLTAGNSGNKVLNFKTATPVYTSTLTLAHDTNTKLATSATTLYNHGATTYYLLVQGVDPLAKSLKVEYRSVSTTATNPSWTSLAYVNLSTLVSAGTNSYYYTLTPVTLTSGNTLQVRARVNSAVSAATPVATNDSANSATLSITDQIAPTFSASATAVVGGTGTYLGAPAATGTFAVSTTTDQIVTVNVTLNNGSSEPLAVPTASLITTAGSIAVPATNGSILSCWYSANFNTLTIVVKVIKNNDLTTDTINVTGLTDASGNNLNNAAGNKTTPGQISINLSTLAVNITQ